MTTWKVKASKNLCLNTFTAGILAASLVISVTLVVSSNYIMDIVYGKERILLTLVNSSFAPLSNVNGSQVTVTVRYQVNDQSLEDEKINGIMKLYSPNGTLLHSSSFHDGFTAKKRGGSEDFKTTIKDPTIQNIIANVSLTDLKKTEILSNVVSANLQVTQIPSKSVSNSTAENQ